jgi:hypothetical protein
VTSLAVVCFLWCDGSRDYRPEHVDVLARAVRRNLPVEHEFVCITDEKGFFSGVRVIAPPDTSRRLAGIKTPEGGAFPSSYRRLWLFSDEARAIADRILLLDVDCVVTRDLSPLLAPEDDFVGWRPNYAWGTGKRLGGGTWLLRTGSRPEVWGEFSEEGILAARFAGFRGSDQAWISYKLASSAPVWPKNAGIYQSQDMRASGYRSLPADARIVHFNGMPKPWDLAGRIEWIRRHWQ